LATRFAGSGKKKSKTRKLKVVRHELPEAEEVSTVTAAGPPGILSQVGTAVANQVTLMLLDLAKEKLTEFVQSMSERKDKEQGNERS
jgi:hypothetical protein